MKMINSISFICMLFLLSGCSVLETYNSSNFNVEDDMLNLVVVNEPYPAYLVIGNFDTRHLYKVDVENNIDVDVDCTRFGSYLKTTISKAVQHSGLFLSLLFVHHEQIPIT